MSIYKRKSGRWAVLIDVDRSADGKRQRRPLGTFPTRKDAERAEREALSARDRGIDLSPLRITIGELMRRYLEDAEARVGAKTLERYRDLDRLHIEPTLGGMALARLRPAHLSEWLAMLLREGRAKRSLAEDDAAPASEGRARDPGLSAKTTRHAFALLKGALSWAVRMQVVAVNAALAVDAPKVARREAVAFTADEVALLLAAAAGTRWEALIAFAAGTGARRGEVAAVKWADVDVENRRVTIRRSLSQTRDGVFEKATKTDRVRVVPLSEIALGALRRQKVAQAADKLAAFGAFDDLGFVFTPPLGGHLVPYAITHAFREIARKAGVSCTNVHALRHSVGTALISSGVDPRTAAAILGHSSAMTTLSIYSHLVEGASSAAVGKIDEFMGRTKAPKVG